jgi:PAS domain S-box-containing protein
LDAVPDRPRNGAAHPRSALSDERKLALFQAVFDEFPDIVLLKDERGDFLLCNQAVARLYGTTPDAMVGKHDDDFGVPKALADGFRANVLGIMASGRTEVVFESSRDATTGELRHFKSVKRPFKDPNGRDQILIIAHDITDIVRAQEKVAQSEFTLQQVMQATQEGIWDWHVPSGRLSHNARWFGILGFEEGEVPDRVEAFAGQLHPEDRDLVWQRIGRLLDRTDAHYMSEHRMLRKDGSVIWVLDRGRVVERDAQGQPVRVVGAYVDISERKHGEVALEQAVRLAQSGTRAKSEFLATMSHELRTPMNGILGMAQLLMTPTVSEAQRVEFAGIILRSGQALLGLLNEILDLSRIEAGKLELSHEAFLPDQLVDEAVGLFREAARLKGLSLSVDRTALPTAAFLGDRTRLRQMLVNYLDNAVKFSKRGGITVTARECGSGGLEFAVADSGIGFTVEQQHRLFQPFSQVDSTLTREHGGSGLGLSIVARLAERMGGQFGAESQPGTGSRFWFRVPARRAPVPAAALAPAMTGHGDRLAGRVLVAEDNLVNREVLALLLGRLGVQMDFVGDGQAALELVRSGHRFDLVLMDVQMPLMDGLEATRCIRRWEQQHALPRTPVLAVTAGVFDEDRRQCLDAGMDELLAKPVDLDVLERMLRRWMA